MVDEFALPPLISYRRGKTIGSQGKFFEHRGTGERYYMRGYYTCISQYVIYAIVCPCGKIYVGETIQKVKSRISQHRSTINVGNAALPLSKHFKDKGHTAEQLKFTILEVIPPLNRES
ncbi:hypothetical protein XELAEV_18044609mg [Xenopus laevis]|uniref:GIY-YIG domain-containing protein n=1 Tax=Xenopus laevis TaxID=8355 RepID=A0A974BZQ8_XENLA|nr:hypothetical protein XELAEV_18044609mg [Xenopus laevis]